MPPGGSPPSENFDEHRDMAGLDHVEDPFADEIEKRRNDREAGNPAEECRAGLESICAEGADAPTDRRAYAGYEDIGNCDNTVDDHSGDDERPGSDQRRNRRGNRKIPKHPLLIAIRVNRGIAVDDTEDAGNAMGHNAFPSHIDVGKHTALSGRRFSPSSTGPGGKPVCSQREKLIVWRIVEPYS